METFIIILLVAYAIFQLLLLMRIWVLCDDVKAIKNGSSTFSDINYYILTDNKDKIADSLISKLINDLMKLANGYQLGCPDQLKNPQSMNQTLYQEFEARIRFVGKMLSSLETGRELPARLSSSEAFCEAYYQDLIF